MSDLSAELVELRHTLHRHAELSEHETQTAQLVRQFVERHTPDAIVDEIAGHGLAAIYRGEQAGPTVLVRAELDALPQVEQLTIPHRSQSQVAAHKCGHDGHMATVAGLAPRFATQRPAQGSVVLLFQPAEETGKGAGLVVEDEKYQSLGIDTAIALHNLPGFGLGQVVLRRGPFASASRGLILELEGATSHAAEPQRGRSPAPAVAQLIQQLSAVPQYFTALDEAAQVTIIYSRLGEVAFGTSPGKATVMATLRAHQPEVMERMGEQCVYLGAAAAAGWRLESRAYWAEDFPATLNDAAVVDIVEAAARALDMAVVEPAAPFAWSEDFGHFTARKRGALFGLGAGEHCPALHHPDYDFPDALIEPGLNLLERATRDLLQQPHTG